MRKLFASFLLLIIATLTLSLLIAFWFVQGVKNPKPFLDDIADSGMYSLIPEELSKIASQAIISEQFEAGAPQLPVAEVVRQIITPAWLQQQLEGNVLSATAWFTGRQTDLYLPIDISQPRSILQKAAQDALRNQFAQVPPCASVELPAAKKDLQSGNFDFHCLPAGVSVDQAMQLIQPILDEMMKFLDNLPSSVDLLTVAGISFADKNSNDGSLSVDQKQSSDEIASFDLAKMETDQRVLAGRDKVMQRLQEARNIFKRVQNILQILVLVDLIFGLALLALLRKSPRSILRSLATICFMDGLALLFLGSVGSIVGDLISNSVNLASGVSPTLQNFVTTKIPVIIAGGFMALRWWGVAGLAAAVVAFAVSFFIPKIIQPKIVPNTKNILLK